MDKVKYIKENYDWSESEKDGVIEINDVTRLELGKLIDVFGYKSGAEIGVYKAHFSFRIMEANPGFRMFGIDPYADYPGKLGGRPRDWERRAKMRMESYGHYSFIKKTSMEAVDDFKDESLDFVYIDADHEFLPVAQDLTHWHKKVKPGGIVAGHDYYLPIGHEYFQVKEVVDAFVLAFRIEPLFILGRDRDGVERDKIRSWFYFKE